MIRSEFSLEILYLHCNATTFITVLKNFIETWCIYEQVPVGDSQLLLVVFSHAASYC